MGGDAPHNPLIDFILSQLAPAEQLGFLRGTIILLSARIGTSTGHPGDVEALMDFNLTFQSRLRDLKLKEMDRQSEEKEKYANVQQQAEQDAVARGFDSANDMQEQMAQTYVSISERINQWEQSTQPGGDPTNTPDVDRLLFDVWRVVNGVPEK